MKINSKQAIKTINTDKVKERVRSKKKVNKGAVKASGIVFE